MGVSTPSGKIEIVSPRAEALGLPRTPIPHVDPRPTSGRLRLLSPGSSWAMNTTYGNDPANRVKIDEIGVTLHPQDAEERGLEEGMTARLANEEGEILLPVHVGGRVLRGVALAPKGAWPKQSGAHSNINVLYRGRKADMGGSTSVHGVEVTVTRAE